MEPVFFIQNNLVDRIVLPVVSYCNQRGYPFIDRSSTVDIDLIEGLDGPEPKIIVGSVQWTARALENPKLAPYVFSGSKHFQSTFWKEVIGDLYLNHDGFVSTVDDVDIHLTSPKHLRPIEVDKAFIGAVYTLDSWKEHLKDRNPTCNVWICEPKEILAEYRTWWVNNKVVAGSQYRKDGVKDWSSIEHGPVFEFVESITERLQVIDIPIVIDVALTPDGYRMIETNPIHGSGWYDAPVDVIMDEVVVFYKNR